MALIVCSECGKKFSDKASACPECGCPTSEIIANTKNDEKLVQSNNTVVTVLTTDEKEKLYSQAINRAKEGTVNAFNFSIGKLKELGDYKDSEAKIEFYEQQIENLKELKNNNKYTIIGVVVLVIIAIIVVFSFKSCSSSDGNDTSFGETITSSSQAINAVKNYNSGTPFSTEQLIASELGFNNFYSPNYGTSDASKNEDGSWEVEINGNMSGYVDDYADEFENYKFTIKATVSTDGTPSISVYKEY